MRHESWSEREPLTAISSVANGFNGKGTCDTTQAGGEINEQLSSDAWSWRIANRVIRLPADLHNQTRGFEAPHTCLLGRQERIRLALTYWVGWNQLSDHVATHALRVESLSVDKVRTLWCEYCQRSRRCVCSPPSQSDSAEDTSLPETVLARDEHDASSSLVRGLPLTWAELHRVDASSAEAAAELARRYGYDVNNC